MKQVITEEELADMIFYLRMWAAENKAYFEDEGEVGFGRECVGIIKDGHYPGYGAILNETYDKVIDEGCPEASPPDGVDNAYHKDDYLAVLGRGSKAIHELFLWVKHLEANDIVIKVEPRRNTSQIELILHGVINVYLRKRNG